MKLSDNSVFLTRLLAVTTIALLVFLIWVSDYAPWATRLTMCTLFCSIIYVRDHAVPERWVAIGIIVIGTLLSLVLSPDFLPMP
ncbi:hypothetical protein EDS67_24690 [candidate division KSB1 bacterium]|nr:MAG: hypothetical protein EDS67_24690 [candidate division KSB1 bacterium]MCE7945206.1 hypothetical protein [Chlorobi bacterium CHB1]MDL1876520.1 hypothetical protein [Cytophagia bacterium CHB2]